LAQGKPKLPDDPRLPEGRNDWERRLVRNLTEYLRTNSQQVNDIAIGRLEANFNADSAAPTSGLFAVGDFVKKKPIVEEGSAGSKYIVYGWLCTQEGSATASSFTTVRFLTGN
jgi:hypothetical protein